MLLIFIDRVKSQGCPNQKPLAINKTIKGKTNKSSKGKN